MDDRWAVVLLLSIAAAYPVETQVSVHNVTHPGATADKPVKMIQSRRQSQKTSNVANLFIVAVFSTYLDGEHAIVNYK